MDTRRVPKGSRSSELPAAPRRLTARMLVVGITLALVLGGGASAAGARNVVVAAVGDIACDPNNPAYNDGAGDSADCRQNDIGRAIAADRGVDAFLPLGDLQEQCGSPEAFRTVYDVGFARLLPRTYPVPGNHEYYDSSDVARSSCPKPTGEPPAADGYFGYFKRARAAGKLPANLPEDATNPATGFYSYELGSWSVIAINTNDMCSVVKCRGPEAADAYAGSEQEQWLRRYLASRANRCVVAYMHYPRWSSNLASGWTKTPDPQDSAVSAILTGIWNDLYAGGAELVLSGHAHNYERFHPLDATGDRDDAFGVRQFIVGTGGVNLEQNRPDIPGSAARMNPRAFGYLRLVLGEGNYSWGFHDLSGATRDRGAASCHGSPIRVTAPARGARITAGTPVTVRARVGAPAASNRVDFMIGSRRVATVPRSRATCHTNIATDPEVLYDSPYCIYSTTVIPGSMPGGATTIRAVANSTDASTPAGVAVASVPVTLGVPRAATRSVVSRDVPAVDLLWSIGSLGQAAHAPRRRRTVSVRDEGLVVASASGLNARLLAGTAGARRPVWVRGDRVIAYATSSGVFTIPAMGGRPTRILTGAVDWLDASPDGRSLAFEQRTASGSSDIWTMSASGTRRRNLTSTPGVDEHQPSWSGSGAIMFAAQAPDFDFAVYRISARGGVARRVAGGGLDCAEPAIAPDGRHIACVGS